MGELDKLTLAVFVLLIVIVAMLASLTVSVARIETKVDSLLGRAGAENAKLDLINSSTGSIINRLVALTNKTDVLNSRLIIIDNRLSGSAP